VAAVTWNDTCLGVHLPGQVCAQAVIPGYRIVLSTLWWDLEVHTDQDGSHVIWFEI
jgi:hypothetical protein